MKNSILLVAALLISLVGVSNAKADTTCNGVTNGNGPWGNLVQNCGFETGDF